MPRFAALQVGDVPDLIGTRDSAEAAAVAFRDADLAYDEPPSPGAELQCQERSRVPRRHLGDGEVAQRAFVCAPALAKDCGSPAHASSSVKRGS